MTLGECSQPYNKDNLFNYITSCLKTHTQTVRGLVVDVEMYINTKRLILL
jgi:hypothetical protein